MAELDVSTCMRTWTTAPCSADAWTVPRWDRRAVCTAVSGDLSRDDREPNWAGIETGVGAPVDRRRHCWQLKFTVGGPFKMTGTGIGCKTSSRDDLQPGSRIGLYFGLPARPASITPAPCVPRAACRGNLSISPPSTCWRSKQADAAGYQFRVRTERQRLGRPVLGHGGWSGRKFRSSRFLLAEPNLRLVGNWMLENTNI